MSTMACGIFQIRATIRRVTMPSTTAADDDANVEGDDPDCSHDAHEILASEQYDLSSVRRSIVDDIGAIDIVRERLRNVRAGLVNNPLSGPPNGEIFTVEDRYCSILIDSEIQTIDFYLSAARELRNRLVERIAEEWGGPKRIGSVLERRWVYQGSHRPDHLRCDYLSVRTISVTNQQLPIALLFRDNVVMRCMFISPFSKTILQL